MNRSMANSDHIVMLKQVVAAWNQWRNAHPKVRPDLSMADLRGMDLGDVDFSGGQPQRGRSSRSKSQPGKSACGGP